MNKKEQLYARKFSKAYKDELKSLVFEFDKRRASLCLIAVLCFLALIILSVVLFFLAYIISSKGNSKNAAYIVAFAIIALMLAFYVFNIFHKKYIEEAAQTLFPPIASVFDFNYVPKGNFCVQRKGLEENEINFDIPLENNEINWKTVKESGMVQNFSAGENRDVMSKEDEGKTISITKTKLSYIALKNLCAGIEATSFNGIFIAVKGGRNYRHALIADDNSLKKDIIKKWAKIVFFLGIMFVLATLNLSMGIFFLKNMLPITSSLIASLVLMGTYYAYVVTKIRPFPKRKMRKYNFLGRCDVYTEDINYSRQYVLMPLIERMDKLKRIFKTKNVFVAAINDMFIVGIDTDFGVFEFGNLFSKVDYKTCEKVFKEVLSVVIFAKFLDEYSNEVIKE